MTISFKRILEVYKIFIRSSLKDNSPNEVKDLNRWRENLFLKVILYSTPVSLVALIPSVIILLNAGYRFMPAYDVFALITVPAVALSSSIKPSLKKWYVL